ncbi:MAG TPA: UDP-N-acetylmuramate dehydrogenase [Phycisphaerales bacterium]|nr:UDP-N-acetylmuramate dehydrogenase [Phycisphaerales bacterium]
MTAVATEPVIQANAPIPTWFGIGGGAERFCVPRSVEELRRCVEIDPRLRVLGDGANLLVDDDGVSELVVELAATGFTKIEMDVKTGRVYAGAGADLAKLVTESVRQGLSGLEGLGGIPATVGGAVMMNAGGAFGEIGPSIVRVFAVDRVGRERVLENGRDVRFTYRHSGLQGLIITGAELMLPPGDAAALRTKLKDVMAYKKTSQPMAENSAGCCFKNPTLGEDVKELGEVGAKGRRVSAGLLIDRAGCKGMRVGGASVSMRHGNFVVTDAGAKARDVIELMGQMVARVRDAFGVTIEPEVVVWSRHQ